MEKIDIIDGTKRIAFVEGIGDLYTDVMI